jgi:preprotein translocase subunit SecF
MEIIKAGTHIDFIGKRNIFISLSISLILLGVVFFFIQGGFNFGIDFAGGTVVELRFEKETPTKTVREGLKGIDLGDSVIQHFGDKKEILIRVEKSESTLEGLQTKIKKALEQQPGLPKFEVERTEMVGPQVGKDLRKKALLAISYALLGIIIYVAWRFELKYGIAAIIALIHDVMITLAAFLMTNREINLPVIAALLAIIGYSLNDTIVVFDRIRENLRARRKEGYEVTINNSINETLSRTLLTSLTTMVVVVCLFFFGGEVIHNFAFALMVGIFVGTYSSIFIASPILIMWRPSSKKKSLL